MLEIFRQKLYGLEGVEPMYVHIRSSKVTETRQTRQRSSAVEQTDTR